MKNEINPKAFANKVSNIEQQQSRTSRGALSNAVNPKACYLKPGPESAGLLRLSKTYALIDAQMGGK